MGRRAGYEREMRTKSSGGRPNEFGDGFGDGTGVEFAVDVSHAGADRVHANIELPGHFLGAVATGEQGEDLFLARAEVLFEPLRSALGTKSLHQESRHVTRNGRPSEMGFVNGLDQTSRRSGFDEIAIGACFERLHQLSAILFDSEHEQRGIGKILTELANTS